MGLVSHNAPAGSAVAHIIDDIEAEVAARGLKIARFDSSVRYNKYHSDKVMWAVYQDDGGKTVSSAEDLPAGSVVAMVTLNGPEGSTDRCDAYRKLDSLRSGLSDLPLNLVSETNQFGR